MDKIAIISDIHGNLPALEAVLADIRARGIELIYNLGDLIGKGPHSAEVVDVCRQVCQVVVRGNWDEYVPQVENNPIGEIYRQQLGAERLDHLRTLPNCHDFWLSGQRVRLFHASQTSVHTRIFPYSGYEAHRAMFDNTPFTGVDGPEPDIVGYGDIHTAYMLPLRQERKLLVNAGSVGYPLDFALAPYVILTGRLDSQTDAPFSVDFVRVPYDIELAVEQARQANVPEFEVYSLALRTAVHCLDPKPVY